MSSFNRLFGVSFNGKQWYYPSDLITLLREVMSFEFLADMIAKFESAIVALGYRQEHAHILCHVAIGIAASFVGKALGKKLWSDRNKILSYMICILMPMLTVIGKISQPIADASKWLFHTCDVFIFGNLVKPVKGGPPDKEGYFCFNKKHMCRHEDGSVSLVKLTGGCTTKDSRGFISTQYIWELLESVEPIEFTPGESALQGMPSNASPAKLEKGNVLIYDSVFNYFSAGLVINDILVMCRHKTKDHEYMVVKGTNSVQQGIRIDLKRAYKLDSVGAQPWNEQAHTCTLLDFMAIPLKKDELAMIGVKSFKEKDVCRNYELQRATITFSVDDFGTIIKEEGSIPEAETEVHDLGLALAKINSRFGASSSPVCIVHGGIKVVGMWLGMPTHSLTKHRETRNLFMHADAVMANLEQLGLYKPALLQQIQEWGNTLYQSLQASDCQLADGNGCSPTVESPLESSGESREDKRTRQARRWREYHEALEREQIRLREEESWMDAHDALDHELYPDMESAARSQAAVRNLLEHGRRMQQSPGQGREPTAFLRMSPDVAAPLSTASSRRAAKIKYFDNGEAIAPPPPTDEITFTGDAAMEHKSSMKAIEELHAQRQKYDNLRDCYNRSYSVPHGENNPVIQGFNMNTTVKSWKYRLLYEEASCVLQEIESFSKMPDMVDVRKRLQAVLSVESNALLRDYVYKTSPSWEAGDEKFAKHGDEIADKDGHLAYFRKIGSYPPSRISKKKKTKTEDTKLQKALYELATRYYQKGRKAAEEAAIAGLSTAEQEEARQLASYGCTKGEYTIPAGTKANIHKSLNAQAKLTTAAAPNLTVEQQKDWEDAVSLVKEKYLDGIGGKKITTYLEEGERGFLKTFLGLEDKSSGASARYRNLKKAVWAHAYPEEVVDLSLSRLILIAVAGDQLSDLTPVELIDFGCSDTKEVFLKPEGHSPAKVEEGRFRLIWISSLIDLTVQSMLHKADNAAHTDAYQAGKLTCAALGMGHSDDGIKQLVKAFAQEGVDEVNISCDASAFDLSIDSSFIFADAERRSENCSDFYVGQLIRRYGHILCSHVLNNYGDVWLVCKYGVTTSGQLSTTTQNSFSRSIQAAYAGCKGWCVAGDDLVGDTGFDAKRLLHFGVRSRDLARHELVADFTSHLIDIKTFKAIFGNVEKLLWHLYTTCVDVSTNRERFGGCLQVLRNTPGVLEDLTAIADEFNIKTEGYVDDTFSHQIVRDFS